MSDDAKEKFNGYCMFNAFVIGFFISAVLQLALYLGFGLIYKQELYRLPMNIGTVVLFVSIFLSERKSERLRRLSGPIYYFCISIVGFVTFSVLFLIGLTPWK